ncbi:MAG: hypothetical protein E7599_04685 [Ruminococcaceae bacterium]|nr:hypothetical protein [Oscillospiraceae bacterium]
MSEKNVEQEDTIIDTEQILAENEALRQELARRDAMAQAQTEVQQAKEEIAAKYGDFTALAEQIERLLCDTPTLLDLAPKERYRIGYLMLKGEQSLSTQAREPSAEELIAALKKHPEVLHRLVKSKKEAFRFALGKSAGIPTVCEKTPQTLAEARHAAIRYAKMR